MSAERARTIRGDPADGTERLVMNTSAKSVVDQLELPAVLNSVAEGLYVADGEGHCLFANRASARMLGYAPEELVGQDMHALIHHSLADGCPFPAEECPILRTCRTGQICRNQDEVFWRRDGTPFPGEYTA